MLLTSITPMRSLFLLYGLLLLWRIVSFDRSNYPHQIVACICIDKDKAAKDEKQHNCYQLNISRKTTECCQQLA